MMELGRKLLPPNADRATVVFDMNGFGPQHMDLGFVRVRPARANSDARGGLRAVLLSRHGARARAHGGGGGPIT